MNHRVRPLLLCALFVLGVTPLFGQIATLQRFDPPEGGRPGFIEVLFSIPEGHYQAHEPDFFGIRAAENAPFTLGEIRYPEGTVDDEGVRKYRGEVILSAEVYNQGPGEGTAAVTAFYQICLDDGTCLFPEEENLTVEAELTGAASVPLPLPRLLFFLLLAFAGGLLLNVMPCVLPVLSIKALSLLKQSEAQSRVIRINALLFGAGVVASLLVLGLFVAGLKSAGEAVGWGFQFQNPGYIFILIAILVAFALSLFDVWILSFTGGRVVSAAASKGGYAGSFASGIFTVLLATPCTAPFLGTALGFAFSQSAPVILLIFLFVGFGLALPFTLLGLFPTLIRLLPKPGPWMERFKEGMGLLLLATAAWLFGVLAKQLGGEHVTFLLFMILGVGTLVWIWGKFGQQAQSRTVRLLTAGLVLLGVFASPLLLPSPSDESGTPGAASSSIPEGWVRFSTEAVEAARAEGVPVFIQFTADWCLTCKTNDLTVFSREDVDQRFRELGVVRFYGDYTNKDEEIGAWIEKFGKAGVPVYALYPPGRDTPLLLPELLSAAGLKNTLTSNLAW